MKFIKRNSIPTTDIQSWLFKIYSIGLKTLLQQGISEPVFYGDLVFTFKRIVR